MDPPKTKETVSRNESKEDKDGDNVKRSPLHQNDADEDDENVKQLQECSKLYLSLQDCLAENDRNWKKCQLEAEVLVIECSVSQNSMHTPRDQSQCV